MFNNLNIGTKVPLKTGAGFHGKLLDSTASDPDKVNDKFTEFASVSKVVGTQVVLRVGDIETDYGVYDFTHPDSIMAHAEALTASRGTPFYVTFSIPWRKFDVATAPNEILPGDMHQSSGTYDSGGPDEHIIYDHAFAYRKSLSVGDLGYNLNLADGLAISRLSRFAHVLGKRYDKHPSFLGVRTSETVFGEPVIADHSVTGFSDAGQKQGMIDFIAGLRAAFPHSHVMVGANFPREWLHEHLLPAMQVHRLEINHPNSHYDNGLIRTDDPDMGILNYVPSFSGVYSTSSGMEGKDVESTWHEVDPILRPSYLSILQRIRDTLGASRLFFQVSNDVWNGVNDAAVPGQGSYQTFLNTESEVVNGGPSGSLLADLPVSESRESIAPQVFAKADFKASLKTSLIPERGGSLVSFSRASPLLARTARGLRELMADGIAVFQGARPLINKIPYSEDFAQWDVGSSTTITPNYTKGPIKEIPLASRIYMPDTTQTFLGIAAEHSGNTEVASIYIRSNTGSNQKLKLYLGADSASVEGGATSVDILATPAWERFYISGVSTSPGTYYVRIDNKTPLDFGIEMDICATGVQFEERPDGTPSEYVPAGVLAAPFTGGGVDGVKWEKTHENGSPVHHKHLLGFRFGNVATNDVLWGRDLTNPVWEPRPGPTELVTNGDFASGTTDWSIIHPSDVSIAEVAGELVLTKLTSDTSANVNHDGWATEVGKQYIVSIDFVGYSATGNIFFNVGSTTNGSDYGSVNMGSTTGTYEATFVALTTTAYLNVGMSSVSQTSDTVTFDNASCRLASLVATRDQIGYDGKPNSATLLEAKTLSGRIFQQLTLAAANRTLSCKMRREQGHGSIFISRKGGAEWTEVFPVKGRWENIAFESSELDPNVGFKIDNESDQIVVDYVRDSEDDGIDAIETEGSAVSQVSPPLEFSATFNNTEGAIAAELTFDDWSVASGYIGSATRGISIVSGVLKFTDGTVIATANTIEELSGSVPIAVQWGPDGIRASINGTMSPFEPYDGNLELTSLEASLVNGSIKNLHVWTTNLTNAEFWTASRGTL